MNLEEASRNCIDPEDQESRLRLLTEKIRVYGDSAWMGLLDIYKWNETPEYIQDYCIDRLTSRLGKGWEHTRTQQYSCSVRINCPNCNRGWVIRGDNGYESYQCDRCMGMGFQLRSEGFRLPVYVHQKTGMEFSLILKTYSIAKHRAPIEVPPFLAGRYPVTVEHFERGIHDGKSPSCLLGDYEGAQLPKVDISAEEADRWCCDLGLKLPNVNNWHVVSLDTLQIHNRYWGDSRIDDSHCWTSRNSDGRLHSPREHEGITNAFGLVDIWGNVAEITNEGLGITGYTAFNPGLEVQEPPSRGIGFRAYRDL